MVISNHRCSLGELEVNLREETLGIGLIGCGAIGSVLAHAIDDGEAGNTRLVVVYDLILQKCRRLAKRLSVEPQIARSFTEFIGRTDTYLIVEAASQKAVNQYASKTLEAGKDLMIMSVGALVDSSLTNEIKELSEKAGRKVYVPSGAIAGLDAVKSASIGRIDQVTLTTRKPPEGLKDVPYLEQSKINIEELTKPKTVYKGPAVEACRLFPANVNVAASLSLAGLGPEKTEVRIVADPTTQRNIHQIEVEGEFGRFTVLTENVASPTNPKTSYLAALSAVATLRKATEHMVIGT